MMDAGKNKNVPAGGTDRESGKIQEPDKKLKPVNWVNAERVTFEFKIVSIDIKGNFKF